MSLAESDMVSNECYGQYDKTPNTIQEEVANNAMICQKHKSMLVCMRLCRRLLVRLCTHACPCGGFFTAVDRWSERVARDNAILHPLYAPSSLVTWVCAYRNITFDIACTLTFDGDVATGTQSNAWQGSENELGPDDVPFD